MIKIRDLDSAHLVALRAKDGTYAYYSADGIVFSKELNTFDATGDNYVLSLYDPLHVRLGDSSTQTAVLA
ncbi:MAG: hypothetical protein KGO93_09875 [Cyanobacteria bacterium REEB446]|nr:hypothetical protein [Cyanobacteria bacterium REEB446]